MFFLIQQLVLSTCAPAKYHSNPQLNKCVFVAMSLGSAIFIIPWIVCAEHLFYQYINFDTHEKVSQIAMPVINPQLMDFKFLFCF